MYDSRPNRLIGFHGCDEAVKQNFLNWKLSEPCPVILNGYYKFSI
jgi:hypothetical protein